MARLSNFEALRIVSLFMVVGIHISVHPTSGIPVGDIKWDISALIGHICRPAVDIFVLIGAYFLVGLDKFDIRVWKRLWRIAYPVAIFAGIALYYVICVINKDVNSFDFIANIIAGKTAYLGPVNVGHLWFIFPYMILVCLAPIMNYAVNGLDKKNYKYTLVILTLFFVVAPSINTYTNQTLIFNLANSLFLFITLYFVAGYIKRFDVSIKFSKGVIMFIVCGAVGAFLTWYVNSGLYGPNVWWHGFTKNFFNDAGILVFLGGIFIFLAFKSISVESRTLNILGKSTYEGFLIQNLLLYIAMDWLKYVQYFKSDVFTFSMVTLGIIALVTMFSLGYGVLRLGIDKLIGLLMKKMMRDESKADGGRSPKGEAQ